MRRRKRHKEMKVFQYEIISKLAVIFDKEKYAPKMGINMKIAYIVYEYSYARNIKLAEAHK